MGGGACYHYDGFFDEAPDYDRDSYASTEAPDDEDLLEDLEGSSTKLGGEGLWYPEHQNENTSNMLAFAFNAAASVFTPGKHADKGAPNSSGGGTCPTALHSKVSKETPPPSDESSSFVAVVTRDSGGYARVTAKRCVLPCMTT